MKSQLRKRIIMSVSLCVGVQAYTEVPENVSLLPDWIVTKRLDSAYIQRNSL